MHIVMLNYNIIIEEFVLVIMKLHGFVEIWLFDNKINHSKKIHTHFPLFIYLAFVVSPHVWITELQGTISWALYSLAQHPEDQANSQEELDRIIGDRNTDYFDWYVFYLDYFNTSIQNGESRLEGGVWIYQRGNQTRERF